MMQQSFHKLAVHSTILQQLTDFGPGRVFILVCSLESFFLYFSFWSFWCLSSLFSSSICLCSLSLAFLVVFLPVEWLRQNQKNTNKGVH
jgi:hypothetical protein